MLSRTIGAMAGRLVHRQLRAELRLRLGHERVPGARGFLGGSGALTSSVDVAVVNQPASSSRRGQTQVHLRAGRQLGHRDRLPRRRPAHRPADRRPDPRRPAGRQAAHAVLRARLRLHGRRHDIERPELRPGGQGQSAVTSSTIRSSWRSTPSTRRTDFPSTSLLNRGQFLPLVVVRQQRCRPRADQLGRVGPGGAGVPRRHCRPVRHAREHATTRTRPCRSTSSRCSIRATPHRRPTACPGMSTMQVTWNPISGLANVATSLVTDRPSAISPTLPACGVSGVPACTSDSVRRRRATARCSPSSGCPTPRPTGSRRPSWSTRAGTAVAPTDAALTAGAGRHEDQRRRHHPLGRTSPARTRRSIR